MQTLAFRVAEIGFAVHGPLAAAELGVEDRLKAFLTEDAARGEDVSIRWEEGDPRPPVAGQVAFDPGRTWKMYRSAGDTRYLAHLDYRDRPGGHQGQALVEANPSWTDIRLVERRSGPEWQSLIGFGASELILRNRIVFVTGLLFHACGVDDRGRGLLVVGHSGSGKSTQSRLWAEQPDVTVLSDDRVAVRLDGSRPRIHGTPWGGDADFGTNDHAPLTAVVVLGQASENTLRPLPRENAAAELAARAFLPFWDASLMERALGVLERLIEQVPVYSLECRPEPDVIPLVRSVL